MSNIRDLILNAVDDAPEIMDCPEWGVKVEIRGMTAGQRGRFLGAATKDGQISHENYMVDMVIQCAYDPESGEQIFKMADRDTLKGKSGAVVQRLADQAAALSGLSGKTEEAKEALEETPA